MINNATKYAVSDIFGIENQIRYIIPKYQREYTWSKNNWEELLSDIQDGDNSHFIGSIICIKTDSDSMKPEFELVDGQQRLTTLSLLFCAIYKLMNEKCDSEDSKLELMNLKRQIINKRDNNSKIVLSRQNNNDKDYYSVLNDIDILEFGEQVNNRGNRIIYKCFRYFIGKLEDLSFEELDELKDKINTTLLVKIEVDSHSDAFILFESLNNRGTPLSVIDLIKNKVLAEMDKNTPVSVDEAFNKWNKIIDTLPDYTIQERFLRHYYNAFKVDKDFIKVEGITKATRSNLIKIYEKLFHKDPVRIFEDLVEKAETYHGFIYLDNTNSELCEKIKNDLIDLVNVKASPAYALLLYIFSEYKNKEVDFYRDIVRFLVKYFAIRNITDFPNTRNLDKIFMDLIQEIKDRDDINSSFVTDYLSHKNRMSSRGDFKDKLKGNLYELNIDATRFILSKIEDSKRTREIHTDFWARDKSKKLIWTIEHIFPEGKNIPKSWVDMIAGGDIDKAKGIQMEHVHTLGNLTLTGYNSNLSNFDFLKKRDRKDSNNNYIGYKNGLFLNEDLKDKDCWTKEDIEERTTKLIQLVLEIFKV